MDVVSLTLARLAVGVPIIEREAMALDTPIDWEPKFNGIATLARRWVKQCILMMVFFFVFLKGETIYSIGPPFLSFCLFDTISVPFFIFCSIAFVLFLIISFILYVSFSIINIIFTSTQLPVQKKNTFWELREVD